MSSSAQGPSLNALRAFEATRRWGTGSSNQSTFTLASTNLRFGGDDQARKRIIRADYELWLRLHYPRGQYTGQLAGAADRPQLDLPLGWNRSIV
jgi:hypothetical protein